MQHWARYAIMTATVALVACDQTANLAKEQVASRLRDPSSAEFRDVRSVGSAVCGEVNGKNAFGAYTGFTRFVVVEGRPLIEADLSTVNLSDTDRAVSELRGNLSFWDAWEQNCSAR